MTECKRSLLPLPENMAMNNLGVFIEPLNYSMKMPMQTKSWGTMDVFMASVVPSVP